MLLRRSVQVCTMEKHASLLHLFRNWCTKSCTLNQPSLCTKHTNLLLFREIYSNKSKIFVMSLQLLFNLQVLDWESDFQKFFQLNNCHTEISVHNIGCPSKGCFVHVWCTIQDSRFWCFVWTVKILYSNQKSVFSVPGFQSVLVFIFVLVSEIGKCYT